MKISNMSRAAVILAITIGSVSMANAADTATPTPHRHHHRHRFHPVNTASKIIHHPVHEASTAIHDVTGTEPVSPKPLPPSK
jgi:hypothetical protein